MKHLTTYLLLISLNSSLMLQAQPDEREIHKTDSAISVDFAFFVAPTRWGFKEYYSIGVERQINKRFSFGFNCDNLFFENKVFSSDVRHDLHITIGPSLKLFPDKRFYLNPFLHLAYDRVFISQEEIKYRGIGFQLGTRIGYTFRKLGVGIKCHTLYSYGQVHDPYFIIKYRNQFHWDVFGYGINLIYTF